MQHQKKSWYRPDIDGLRALAVIPVILFHANILGFGGGYVGVDIFFVISGFLITAIIYREIKEDRFSMITFWERRARRIIPAMFVVVMATLVASYFIVLFPIDFIDIGQSTFAQAIFLANIFFMRKNNYFADPNESLPLLHTWSLAVEEQFYIGFPILMIIIWRFWRRALVPILVIIGVASLAYAHYLTTVSPGTGFSTPFYNVWQGALNSTAAFYFLPARAFELIIGAVLAVTAYGIRNRPLAEVLAIAGLFAISIAITTFTKETPFPGITALLPTIGTAAIIAANTHHTTFVGRVLSFPLFIWIGLISYSLYLWHWPVLEFGRRYFSQVELGTMETNGLIVLSFVLAYLSYRFVETPFRTKALLPRRNHMLLGGGMALIIMAGTGWHIATSNGYPERAPAVAQAIAVASVDFSSRRNECFVNSFSTSDEPCYIGTENKDQIDVVFWGDSHGASLLPMLEEQTQKYQLSGATFFVPGCMPVSGVISEPHIKKCEDVKVLVRDFVREHNVQNVVLISRWASVAKIRPQPEQLDDLPDNLDREEQKGYLFETALSIMAEELAADGTNLTIVKQVPQHRGYNARIIFYEAVKDPHNFTIEGTAYAEHIASNRHVNDRIDAVASAHKNVSVIDPAEALCRKNDTCTLLDGQTLLYENADHINKTGSFLVAPVFEDFFSSLE